nr:DUF2927 domain-containing protein [Roseovarius litorisediminis]
MGLGLMALAACDLGPVLPASKPQARPAGLMPEPPVTSPSPSPRSEALARYYARVQADLLAQGLLRTGGGGVDTPYTDTDLLRNFETIAFYDEYAQGGGFRRASGSTSGGLRKWTSPVRMAVEFGAHVPVGQQEADRATVRQYAARLARVTLHPISADSADPNFHVLFMSEDDRAQAVARVKQIVPGISASALSLFRDMPRSIHCLVVAFSARDNDYSYRRAIAFIRSEHPDLMRRSCVHEELAQGLGLANDSPRARPSIFNDDDEFALLTTHDEELLRLLYNPALTPGMSADEARPIAQRILSGRLGPV